MTSETSEKPYVAIVYYSMYGHIRTMAASVAEGLKESIGDEYDVKLFQVPETLSEEVLGKLGAAVNCCTQIRYRISIDITHIHICKHSTYTHTYIPDIYCIIFMLTRE